MAQFTQFLDPYSGPVINIGISISKQRRAALIKEGFTVPDIQAVRALLDTGASGTCVDPSVLEALKLTPTGTIQIHTPSSGSTPAEAEQYDVGILVPGQQNQHPLIEDTVPVTSAVLSVQGIGALIGRDILSRCLFIYNGASSSFTLAF